MQINHYFCRYFLTFSQMLKSFFKPLILFVCFVAFSVANGQTTRYVTTYSGLTSAITASSTSVIDIIEISNDIVVTADIPISKSITINGNGNKITVSINGVSDAGVNNTGSGGTSTASNYGVFSTSGTTVITINNLTIKGGDNSTTGGGCINNTSTKLVLNNCVISNGRNSSAGGGGIYNDYGATLYMTNCNLTRNSAQYGGGFINLGTMYVEKCTFSENRSESSAGGGGACENQSTLYINNSTFSNNKSTEIGGAINNYGGQGYISNSTFSGNVAYGGTYSGGAIGNNGGSITAVNCLFAYNYYLTGGTVTNPTAFTLEDLGGLDNSDAIYCIQHSSSNMLGSGSNFNKTYAGKADGSDNTIFAGGIYTKITDGTGTEIGTAKVFQPYLVSSSSSKTATLKIGSYPNVSTNKGCITGYTNGNGSPVFGYKNMSTSTWVNIVGTTASSNAVTTDQLSNTRASIPTVGSVESEISTVYMLKVLSSSNGKSTGGSLYGDVYSSGTQITLTASPNSGYQFSYWQNTATSSSVSTSNPYTLTLTADLTLIPIFTAAATTYSVTYNGNNNTTGQAPNSQTFTSGSVTLPGKNTLEKADYYFSGWNTQPNGTGTNYAVGASYSTSANLTLYAVWTPYVKYYPKVASIASLNQLSSWSGTPDGTGGSPSNFGADKQFILSNSSGSTGFTTGGNLTILGLLNIVSGSTLNITSSSTLTQTGSITGTGSINGNSGSTLVMNGSEAQTLTSSNTLASFTINNTAGVTISGTTSITETLTLTAGALTTNDKLTIKSNATNTGIIGPVTSGSVSGNVIIEKYIPSKRAYRLLSSPVTTSGTIYQNWQEGGNTTTGLGTDITGSTTGANGFDQTQTGNASMYTHDNATGTWSAISNTNSNKFTAGNPYRIMIRGDRNIDLSTNTPTPNNTTLRTTGTIVTGNQTVSNLSTTANGFSLVGNPYQAPVNMQTVLSAATNLNTSFYYIWDPKMSTRGAYVTVDVTTNSNSVGSAANKFVQPGQACFVKTSSSSSASLTFTESSKGTSLTSTFGTDLPDGFLNTRLYQRDSLNNGAMASDGFLIKFKAFANNQVDQDDALKPTNQDENLAIKNDSQLLSIETRKSPATIDTVKLNLTQYRSNAYSFKFEFDQDLGFETYLIDNYTTTKTLIPSSGVFYYEFDVNSTITSSVAKDRFSLVFKNISTGLDEISGKINFSAFPNPSKGNIVIKSELADQNENFDIELINALGQVVFNARASNLSSGYNMNLQNVNAGVYTIQAQSKLHNFKTKVILH